MFNKQPQSHYSKKTLYGAMLDRVSLSVVIVIATEHVHYLVGDPSLDMLQIVQVGVIALKSHARARCRPPVFCDNDGRASAVKLQSLLQSSLETCRDLCWVLRFQRESTRKQLLSLTDTSFLAFSYLYLTLHFLPHASQIIEALLQYTFTFYKQELEDHCNLSSHLVG